MKNIIYILLFILLFSACEKTVNTNYQIQINGVSSSTVRFNDTLSVYVDWLNSEHTDNVTIKIDTTDAEVLSVIDTTIKILIPLGWEQGKISIKHPNGAEDVWWRIDYENSPIVNSISSLNGKAGDKISIKGMCFLSPEKLKVRINTQDCAIESINDTNIIITVPKNCGNGQIQIQYWNSDFEYCFPDVETNIGLFKYNYPNTLEEGILEKYSIIGLNYALERDASGRVIKRIISVSSNIVQDKEEVIVYNTKGLVDTILTYVNNNLYRYKVFNRNNDNTQIEVSEFDDDDIFQYKNEFFLNNNRVTQVNAYLSKDNYIYLGTSEKYEYNGAYATINRTAFESNGTIRYEESSQVIFDIDNYKLPDLGIPGYIQYDYYSYPVIKQGVANSKTFYNDYGQLIRIEHYQECVFKWNKYTFTYK